ncbi:MAG: Uma2 family endonuclease [Planctomycetes bacterium]|nr:Uma2 family endonuclease [Planctomycetota bacterium]
MATVLENEQSPQEPELDSPRIKMTLQEFNALEEDPVVDRMLIRGELWEKPMTKRNRWHAQVEARIAQLLSNWCDGLPQPRGGVFSGEVGCEFPDLETGFGIDIAYFSSETLARQNPDGKYLVGAPVLAVEVLSPSEQKEEIDAKVRSYLDGGVRLIWIVDYTFQTVTQYRPEEHPQMFSGDAELSAESDLPGFSVPVSALFER